MRTILQIANYIAPQIKIDQITSLITSQETEHIDLANCINSAGQEVATRIDWPQLKVSASLVGAGNAPISLPNNFSRLLKGQSVKYQGATVRGALSDEEFENLAPIVGNPRYFRLVGSSIELWPFINSPNTVSISYLSKGWLVGNKEIATVDGDIPLFDDFLVIKGAEWRWRRMKGQEYKDQLDEFEAEMRKQSGFSLPERTP